jgi:hypothetical protein
MCGMNVNIFVFFKHGKILHVQYGSLQGPSQFTVVADPVY